MATSFLRRFAQDLGIDLGTANTLVHVRGRGVVLSEPSVVAIDRTRNVVCSVGEEAKAMIGRTPAHIETIRPLKDGVIADFEVTREMLKHFISRAHRGHGFASPRVVVGIPSGITEVEKRAVIHAAQTSGARAARTIEEPMAAAIGAGLPINSPSGSMIVDIGGGTTEVAVISLGGIVTSRSLRVGGDEMDDAIRAYLRRHYNLLVGERTAEAIKLEAGSAWTAMPDAPINVRGRDLVSGLPACLTISSSELREAMREPVNSIIEVVRSTLESAPPELAADIMEKGITLSGGGALLRGMDAAIERTVQTPVHIADAPLTCVALGTAKVLEDWR